MAVRLAVLASGSGSNFDAIATYFGRRDAAEGEHVTAAVALLISNNAAAGALARAEDRGIQTAVLRNHADPAELSALLEEHNIGLVALAGYLKLVPVSVVRQWRDAILNIHPALLPDFGGAGMYGRRVHQAVLDSGAKVSGATVHMVTAEYDSGPIIAQCTVPVLPRDSAETLAARVLEAEHFLYPRAIDCFLRGAISASHPMLIPEGADPREYMRNMEITH